MIENTGKSLHDNELLYQNLFTSMNEGLAICELILDESGKPDDYRHLEVNPAFERIIGVPADQVRGKTRREFGYADPYWLELFEEVVKTGEPASRVDYSSGSGKWFDLRAFSLGGGKFGFLFMDITEYKRLEENERRSHQQFQEIIKSIQDGFLAINRDWRITYINERAASNGYFRPEELIGENIWDKFPYLVGHILETNYRKAMEERVSIQFEMPGKLHDIWYEVRIYPTADGITVYWLDKTDRKRVENELVISEKNLAVSQEIAHIGSYTWDLEKDILIWSDELYRILGLIPKQIRPSYDTYTSFIHPEDREDAIRKIKCAINESKPQPNEHRILRNDGTVKLVQVKSRILKENNGKPLLIHGVVQDITEQKRAEEAIEATRIEAINERNRLQAVMDALPVGVAIVDIHGGNIRVNHEYEQIWSSPRPPVQSVSDYVEYKAWWVETGHQVKPEEWGSARAVQKGETVIGQFMQIERFDGTLAYVLNSAAPVFDAHGQIIGSAVVIHDITKLKELETALRESKKLAAIVETSEDAIISMTPEGKISSWNRGAKKLYGYNAEEVMGKPALMIVPIEYHQQMRDVLRNLYEGQVFEDNRAVRIHKDETLIYVSIKSSLIRDAAGNIVEISSIHRDITERIKSEEALAKERELLMVTLNSLTEGVVATDSEDRIFLINEAALNLTGFTHIEAIDEPLNKIIYIIDDKTSEPVIDIINKNNLKNQIPRQLVLVTRDLKEVPISIHSSPIKSANSRIIGAVTVIQDITAKHKTEQELFKAEKLESLGILAGGIAHDFNNFLAAILSNIQLAQLKYRKNKDIEKYLQESIESTYRASELTRQLLTFSKGGAPVKKAASLVELIRDTAEFALRGSKVKAECFFSETLWQVEVDIGQISQVIHNLVINAKQAMPKGGTIKINAENLNIESNQQFNPGNYVKIIIKDQGVGIPKENLVKIFYPFFTTKEEGTGLGLATSYSIIRQHDGYLEVESEVGLGTNFVIHLPALIDTIISPKAHEDVAVTSERLKILLMDDEKIILKSMGEMLEFYGHQVMLTIDGSEAIDEYRQALNADAPFDVVIMDLTVPGGMGGQEAIAHLRDIDPKIKAIVSSGYANDPIISDYKRFGFCGVMTKPYKIDELNEVLNRLIERKQLPLEFNMT